jgi:hypothetical protein
MGNGKGGGASAAAVPWPAFLGSIGSRCARAGAEWIAHSLLLFVIFASIQGLHYGLTHWLGVSADKKFFERIPMQYLFDGADFALLVAVGVIGVYAAVRSYQGKH